MGQQLYSSGSGNWTAQSPSPVVHLIGGGGGGGATFNYWNNQGGHGGGGGAYAKKQHTGLSGSVAYVVGAAGQGRVDGAATAGGDTTFVNAATHKAAGGQGGSYGVAGGSLGGTTAASVGDTKFKGGDSPHPANTGCSGGGGGAGSGGAGSDGVVLNGDGTGGAGGASDGATPVAGPAGGAGGPSQPSFDYTYSVAPFSYGGAPGGAGGSGASSANGSPSGGFYQGGHGAAGYIQIDWTDLPPQSFLRMLQQLPRWNAVRRTVNRMVGREATLEELFPLLHIHGMNFGDQEANLTDWEYMRYFDDIAKGRGSWRKMATLLDVKPVMLGAH